MATLACLYDNLGNIVPYARLCLLIGCRSKREAQRRHVLRQSALRISQLLQMYEAPYVLASAKNFGYGLCEVASSWS